MMRLDRTSAERRRMARIHGIGAFLWPAFLLWGAACATPAEELALDCSPGRHVALREEIAVLRADMMRQMQAYRDSGLYPSLSGWEVCVAARDLNGDGKDDVLAYYPMEPFCGTDGCLTEIFLSGKNAREGVFSGQAFGERIGLLGADASGVLRLKLFRKADCGEEPGPCGEKNDEGTGRDNAVAVILSYDERARRYREEPNGRK
jgi:hypothetical protein